MSDEKIVNFPVEKSDKELLQDAMERIAKLELLVIKLTDDVSLFASEQQRQAGRIEEGILSFVQHIGKSLIESATRKTSPVHEEYKAFHLEHVTSPDRIIPDSFVLFEHNDQPFLALLSRVVEHTAGQTSEIKTMSATALLRHAIKIRGMSPHTLKTCLAKYGDRSIVNIFHRTEPESKKDA